MMFGIETINEMNREAGKKAKSGRKEPLLVYDTEQFAEQLRHIPNLGDYRPRGWKLVNTYFVDSSGFGQVGEPALTFGQFIEKMKVGLGYAIIEAGQFQVRIGEFEKCYDLVNNRGWR
jgi:hypothetical protein